jgi:tetratricopeptide (TPR) repeat protein
MKPFLMLAALWACGGVALAEPSEFNYGLHLFQAGDYYRSITELDRARYFSPKSKDAEGALWLIAAAYMKGERWDLALQYYQEYLASYPEASHALQARFFMAEAAFQSKKQDLAKRTFEGLLQRPGLDELSSETRLRLAGLAVMDSRWQDASAQFEEVRKLEPSLTEELDQLQQWTLEGMQFKPYSLSLACLSSALIPGSGQMECGYYGDGLATFTVVGGLAAWAINLFMKNQQAAGTVFLSLRGVFYLGNLQGAILAANRANRDRPKSIVKKILDALGEQTMPEPDLKPWINSKS